MAKLLTMMAGQTAASAPTATHAGAAATQAAARAGEVATSDASQNAWEQFWFTPGASVFSHEIDFVFHFITWICVFFFVLVVVLMLWFMWKYRQRGREGAQSQTTHNTPLELTWTIIPLILVIAIFYVGMKGYVRLRGAPADSYVINVTGQQWSWTFGYPNGASPLDLVIPAGKPVKLMMTSADVLHAFYVPAFRVKQDVVPGKYSFIWFQADKEGVYPFFCAEYCGKDHSQMAGRVVVLNEAAFQKRMAEELVVPEGDPMVMAKYAYDKLYPRCSSCHTLDGKTGTGPTWKGLYKKLTAGEGEKLADGTNVKELIGEGKAYLVVEEYLRESILAPQKRTVQGYAAGAMPAFQGGIKEKQLNALMMLFKHMDEVIGEDGKWKGPK